MFNILVLREKIKEIYVKYNVFIIAFIKFFLVYISLLIFNLNVSYTKLLSDPLIIMIVSLTCAILPFSLISVIVSLYLVFSIFMSSIEMAIFIAGFLFIIAIIYYSFKPGDSYLLLLIPLSFALKIPYIIPLLLGLSGSVLSIIPVGAGVILYYLLVYFKDNIGNGVSDSVSVIGSRYVVMLNTVFSDKSMYLFIIAFLLTIILVYLIHNMSFNYSWDLALAVGIFTLLAVISIGQIFLKIRINVIVFIFSLFISSIMAYIYKFFIFNVDYSRTEYLNFEDDEYFYYVKAVPKVSIGVPDIKIKRINITKKEEKKNSN